MKNKLFNNHYGNYNGIKIRTNIVRQITGEISQFLWRIRNKRKFMEYVKALKNNCMTKHILLN